MFRETLCPSSGMQGCTLLHMVFSTGVPKTPASTLGAENHMQQCTALHSWRWAQWCPKHVELLVYQ